MPGRDRMVLRVQGLPLPPGTNHQYVHGLTFGGRRNVRLSERAEAWMRQTVEALTQQMAAQGATNRAVIKTNGRSGDPYLAPDRAQIAWIDVLYEQWTYNQDGDAPEKLVADAVQAALGVDDWWMAPPLGIKHIVHRKAACHLDLVVVVAQLPYEQAWNKRAEQRAAALYTMLGVERTPR